ncbi:PKD domain-containing protein [Desertivirga arenae]|uniref:PKD domain-containing protein n=1 Tax=Desertivirga arenae TaxID=2810309 RepID=UPI001A95C475|nr:PKD domain-containing protein [Pedobacter sp. SYSU D00823]
MTTIKLLIRALLCLFVFVLPAVATAQNTSNKGKEFWLGYGIHVSVNRQQMALYITSDVNTSGKIEVPGIGYSDSFTVTANSITIVNVPQQAFLNDEGGFQKGIHVTAERPIVVYGHIYDQNVSGASLILPVSALGKEYYSINYKQVSNADKAYSYFFIVATEDNTEVDITPSADTKGGRKAGETFRVNLSKGEVYQVLGELTGDEVFGPRSINYYGADLTGSVIRSVSTGNGSCKRIAVFSGSAKIGIGCRPGAVGSSDNLFQQVYPTAAWGKNFITAPLASRNYDVIRIVKSNPAAVVKLNGILINPSDFVNNFYYDFKSQQVNVIESDQPIQVAQYAVTQSQSYDCGTIQELYGDPEMIYLNPIEQNIDDITVYSPSAYAIQAHFINVVIKTEAAASFKIDGVSQQYNFRVVPGNPLYSYAQLSIPNGGVHHLQAEQGFNAIAYGFGNAESYGYSAGTNLKGMNVLVKDKASNQQVTSGCLGADLTFRIDLVYPVKRLVWDFKNGTTPLITTYTQPDSSYTLNGNIYYVYKVPSEISFAESKDYTIEVTAEKQNSDGCGDVELIPIDFSIYSPPVPDFTVVPGCQGAETAFTDNSDNKGRELKKWHWEFGDGTTSEEQNPHHVYIEGGEYTVTLTIRSNTTCGPISVNKTIRIDKKPVPVFSNTNACVGEKVVFTDGSTSVDGQILNWIWEMGNGDVLTKASPAAFDYTFASVGNYTVKLLVTTDRGCQAILEKSITVHPKPVVDFTLPEVCISDAYAEFLDASTISDNSQSQFQYHWDFGDGSISTQKNGRHRYQASGVYTVTLTVTSAFGCSEVISKPCTVNGGIPIAAFSLQTAGAQCSDKEVTFINNSRVNFGSITRVEWYYDLDNEPELKVVDEEPEPGKVYFHKYPTFFNPATKTVRVKQVAYSGSVCFNEKIETITLNGIAQVDFDSPTDICMEVPSLQINASNPFNYSGSGRFSGDGISEGGLFKPRVAGEGLHTITYTFRNANGCDVSLKKDIMVWVTPRVNAGDDKTIVAFGQTQLQAETDIPVISYKWTPATGLSRDDVFNPIASPASKTTYTVTVISEKGCTSSATVSVDVLGTPYIPNTFTPNNDGANDVWEIEHLESLPGCTIKVFNRNGQIVFQTIGYAHPWDGRSNGQALPEGAYYYILDPRNGRKSLSGSVMLLR